MQYKLSTLALIGTLVLLLTSCSTQRSLRYDVRSQRSVTTRDTVREQVVVAVHDTVMETKTITITKNEHGDTTFTSMVTERDRLRNRSAVRDKEEKLVVRTDTVYLERRDSAVVKQANISHHTSSISHLLKWTCFIILGLIALIITVKGRCK